LRLARFLLLVFSGVLCLFFFGWFFFLVVRDLAFKDGRVHPSSLSILRCRCLPHFFRFPLRPLFLPSFEPSLVGSIFVSLLDPLGGVNLPDLSFKANVFFLAKACCSWPSLNVHSFPQSPALSMKLFSGYLPPPIRSRLLFLPKRESCLVVLVLNLPPHDVFFFRFGLSSHICQRRFFFSFFVCGADPGIAASWLIRRDNPLH